VGERDLVFGFVEMEAGFGPRLPTVNVPGRYPATSAIEFQALATDDPATRQPGQAAVADQRSSETERTVAREQVMVLRASR